MSERNLGIKFYIPIVISIIALIISVLSVFKDKIFPFELKVLAGELAIVPTKTITDNIPLLFPMSFINSGYSDGIVESISIRVIDGEENVKLYIPIVEIDFMRLLQKKRRLNVDSMRGMFSPFAIPSKSSSQRSIVFAQELKSEEYPFTPKWTPGKHRFEIYLRASNWEMEKKVAEFEQVIPADAIDEYFKRGKGFFLMHPLLE